MTRNSNDPELVETLSDAALLGANQRTTEKLGDPEADALLAEIERRGLEL